jgi:hypothetical protein
MNAAIPPPELCSDGVTCARTGRVLLTTEVPRQKTAWTKARQDVQVITAAEGFVPLALPASLASWAWPPFLSQLGQRVGEGGTVLVEYPFEQRRRIYPLWAWCRLKGVRLLVLIHDLHALRFGAPTSREIAILRLFDGLISHNPAMSRWLRGSGIDQPVADLQLFDYLLAQEPRAWHETHWEGPLKVVCAGNLSHPKARYIYDKALAQLQGVELSLFGAFFEPERMPPSPVRYHGVFDPDTPALDGRYHFGLVWDGESAHGVQGHYGHYMRYNNPHKVSLYAALGLPVVVWEEAALAPWVLAQGVGVAIGDLRELADIRERLSPADHARMALRMARLQAQVTQGRFLRQALHALGVES